MFIGKPFQFRKIISLLVSAVAFLTLFVSGSVAQVAAQTSPIDSCILTPEMLSGQGFSLSGQGFSLSGQGFTLSGQGFSLSGQGFSLSGQGFSLSGQAAVVAEIQANPVTPGKWLLDRLPFFNGADRFNTIPTAILVVDDFAGYAFPTPVGRATDFLSIALPKSHGGEVMAAVLDSINAVNNTLEPDLNIWIVPVDISAAGVNYETDNLVPVLESTTASLRASKGVTHFVYNFSFGLIACADPGNPAAGIPAFDFHQLVTQVKQANQTQSVPKAVTPIVECITISGDHYGDDDRKSYAYFGYQNDNNGSVNIPVSNANNFSERTSQDQGQPRLFETGRQRYAFKVDFNGNNLTWKLVGPDGVTRTATANRNTPRCGTSLTRAIQAVTPVLECVATNPAGGYIARFGYNNPNPANTVAIITRTGGSNKFTSSPADRGQTTTFLPGLHKDVFRVPFSSGNLVWSLNGISATATPTSPACPTDSGIGIADQMVKNGLSSSQIAARMQSLTQVVTNDPNLQPLRSYMQQKLALSANRTQPEQHIPVASSGNYRPWLGTNPLSPAAWSEFIATGATLDNTDNMWSFSQYGNILAPGAGYPLFYVLGANTYGAGTSFAAPIFSSLAAVCATQPFGVSFDGVNPPLTVLNKSGNLPINATTLAPFACSINHAPTASAQAVTTDEDTSVAFTLTASDVDAGDSLIYTLTAPLKGVLSGVAPALTYTPNANLNGSDSFSYQVCDSKGACATAVVSITVNPVNDAPTTSNQSVATDEDMPTAITLVALDVDDAVLTYILSNPAQGVLSGTAPALLYTPNADFNGGDGFGYQVCDAQNACASGAVSITVNAVNDPPVAADQPVVTNEDTPVSFVLNAYDVDSPALIYTLVPPTSGVLSGEAPNLTYTPLPNFFGSDSFKYRVCDADMGCAVATVNITVNAVNDLPLANSLSVTTNQNTPVAITLVAVDVEDATLTYTVGAPISGVLSGTAPNLVYTPNANFYGADSFGYQVCDTAGACANAVVSITVNLVNAAPVCTNAAPLVVEDGSDEHRTITVTIQGVVDPNGDAVSIIITSVYQDEEVDGTGDGNTSPDATGIGTSTVTLRNERDGSEDGRVYHLNFTASDVWGASCSGAVTVSVDHDHNHEAEDDGEEHDSSSGS